MGQARAVKVRYTKRALAQIDQVLTYIEVRSPQGAGHVRDRIVALIALLENYPYAGRTTTRAYVRRLPVNPYPYLIDYRVTATEIVIMRFRHAARRPPKAR
ncbi:MULTISPECIES: type II toxin-antitoxin system RelE/ParE family toxin [unclassified Bradyrhizobium]|uniref:type II toxin-antitoxin system RelE/ParE family toxin n=1 Tax=unclassified Bradyrhizobium TaxID=2631580 RepID=UPI001CD2D2D9|nr:type II toxin-antitoxin system RelE/ParE family toxin [Bradyrhizobium sp. IC3195]MCA1496948.1 type II toxin-antitoxin system RelE/ParE family toxin [Bradyrhizobium sp. NBAIM14]MCA1534035.1 type II toxin-antitoxin system RelE/ParE family toxin [Bradyrhizobium sp. NBAIM03]